MGLIFDINTRMARVFNIFGPLGGWGRGWRENEYLWFQTVLSTHPHDLGVVAMGSRDVGDDGAHLRFGELAQKVSRVETRFYGR